MRYVKMYQNIDSDEAKTRRGGFVLRKLVFEIWHRYPGTNEAQLEYRGRVWHLWPRRMRRRILQRRIERALRFLEDLDNIQIVGL